MFKTATTSAEPFELAPDGSEVRPLVATERGSLAHFTFPAGVTTPAVRHRQVDEVWYIADGTGQMWRSDGSDTAIVDLGPGTGLSIPVGTSFQVSVNSDRALLVIGVTMPPWPPEGDADIVEGVWEPTDG
ncbi:MAG: cupin domain-containing protein [Acidimicrobiales bacterium]